ncbi:O-antigen ligase family protein [Desulforamulus aeronauticus]|uniref:O-antigen ligase n=1 Tax=Desulforamulus aeronauticus DSM 10349 TaxID=1121421 RepID=A0A1M6T403_9FIRM|nr:O-antigen ligase family protein [Desulforamulus aeronauticus]SHK51733.1 O-antigen ligase [Desulforamulus aeronauticus DSM 10349]
MENAKALPLRDRINLETESFFQQIAFGGFCFLLFISPFFSGLFFPEDQRIALLYATIIFLFTSIISFQLKTHRFFSHQLDYLILGLPIVYLIATFTAANYALSIDEVVENLLYFLMFWSAVRLIRTPIHIQKIFTVLFFAAIFVSLVGLFTASGWLDIKSGFITSDGGTIASTFQYKNTLASFLTAIILIGFYLRQIQEKQVNQILVTLGNFILLLVLFSTQSHGGYMVYAIFIALLWFLSPAEKRLDLIIISLLLSLIGLVGSKLFLANIAAQNSFKAWLYIGLGVIVVTFAQWAVMKCIKRDKQILVSLKHLLILALIAGVAISIVMSYMGVFRLLLEKLHMLGAMERLTMYEDGLRMIKERPFTGWGGGGWPEAYSVFQSYGYTVRQTHSYFLQLAIETGLLGLTLVISIWGLFLVKAYKAYRTFRKNAELQALTATLIGSVLAIISHAVFDFDLSLAALTMTMLTLMACLVSLDRYSDAGEDNKLNTGNIYSGSTLAVSIIASLVIFAGGLMLISSENLTSAAVEAINTGDGKEAIRLTKSAITMNPLRSENYGLAAQLYAGYQNKEESVKNAELAVSMAKYNPDRYLELANIYLYTKQSTKAVAVAQKAIELTPLKLPYYERYSDIVISASINDLRTGNRNEALHYSNEILSIPSIIDETLSKLDSDKKKLWMSIGAQPLVISDKIRLNMGIAYLIHGNLDQAIVMIDQAAKNQEVQKTAVLWQALVAQKQGDVEKAEALLNSEQKNNSNIKKQFEEMAKLI